MGIASRLICALIGNRDSDTDTEIPIDHTKGGPWLAGKVLPQAHGELLAVSALIDPITDEFLLGKPEFMI